VAMAEVVAVPTRVQAVGGNDFDIKDAGVLPFPLRKFEALQHAHLRRVLKFAEHKMIAAIGLLRRDGPLAALLNNGMPYEVSNLSSRYDRWNRRGSRGADVCTYCLNSRRMSTNTVMSTTGCTITVCYHGAWPPNGKISVD
jgi:hypothetical protein